MVSCGISAKMVFITAIYLLPSIKIRVACQYWLDMSLHCNLFSTNNYNLLVSFSYRVKDYWLTPRWLPFLDSHRWLSIDQERQEEVCVTTFICSFFCLLVSNGLNEPKISFFAKHFSRWSWYPCHGYFLICCLMASIEKILHQLHVSPVSLYSLFSCGSWLMLAQKRATISFGCSLLKRLLKRALPTLQVIAVNEINYSNIFGPVLSILDNSGVNTSLIDIGRGISKHPS